MSPVAAPALLIAAHGTESAEGLATLRAIVAAVAEALPDVAVSLCFLDVVAPSLAAALDAHAGPVIVVPLVLSSGYHALNDIPAVIAGRASVRVTRHLGPEPALADVMAARLLAARAARTPASTALAAIGSSRKEGRAEVAAMADLLGSRVARTVPVVPLFGDVRAALSALPQPVEVATYLVAAGASLAGLRAAVDGIGWLTEPIGADPALVGLLVRRYVELP